MNEPPNPSRPTPASFTRVILRFACIALLLVSVVLAARGVLTTAYFLNDEIPAGAIRSMTVVKDGWKLKLDNGREGVFPISVVTLRPEPIKLFVGDHVEKRRQSILYFVNGRPVTNGRWILRHWLLHWSLFASLAAYLVLGTAFVVRYRRTPLGDALWTENNPRRPARPKSVVGQVGVLVIAWFILVGAVTLTLSCVSGALGTFIRMLPGT